MASTKALTVIRDNVTLTAGAGDITSTGVNLVDGYGGVLMVKITNGATGPTVAAQTQVQISGDDSNYFNFGGPLVGKTSNNGISSWVVEVPMGAMYIRTVSGSNTGQNVTLRISFSEVTAVS